MTKLISKTCHIHKNVALRYVHMCIHAGTLTQNRMEVTDIYSASQQHAKVFDHTHTRSRDSQAPPPQPKGQIVCGEDVVTTHSHPDLVKVIEVCDGTVVHMHIGHVYLIVGNF